MREILEVGWGRDPPIILETPESLKAKVKGGSNFIIKKVKKNIFMQLSLMVTKTYLRSLCLTLNCLNIACVCVCVCLLCRRSWLIAMKYCQVIIGPLLSMWRKFSTGLSDRLGILPGISHTGRDHPEAR